MKKIILIVFFLLIAIIISLFGYYKYELSSVSNNKTDKNIEIGSNKTGSDIATILKENNLIRSELVFKIYLKINNINNLKSGIYTLNQSMSVEQIVDKLVGGKGSQIGEVSILFKEGLNMRQVASVIANNTSNTKEDVFNTIKDQDYLDELIHKYWFLSNDIKNTTLYYSLEGYLAPNTYRLANKNVSVKNIIETMLNQNKKVLSKYKNELTNKKYTIHQYLTLASIAELEGLSYNDRATIAGVLYNRLNNGMSLGSDVTTYYAAKIDYNSRDLYTSELNALNPYNTRGPNMAGKLPIGPICNPSEDSIRAVLEPISSDYYYFVADKNGKVYFSKTSEEQSTKIKQIKEAGLWVF